MRCLGIKKGVFERCKNDCKIIYCHNHRFQWWIIIGIIATLGGLFQDVIKPIFSDDENTSLQNERDSLNSIISKQNEIIEKQVKEFEDLQIDFEKIRDEIIIALRESNYQLFNREDIFLQKEDDKVNAILKVSQKFFIGEYRTEDVELRDVMSRIEAFFKENGLDSNMQIEITGSADGALIKPGTLRYRGEFGEVLIEQYFNKNRKVLETLELYEGFPLTNESIAFLRAYNVKFEILKSLDMNPEQIRIAIIISKELGAEFREYELNIQSE